MNEICGTIHLVDNLIDSTVEGLLNDPNCSIVLCSGDASSEEERKNVAVLNACSIAVYTKCNSDTVTSALNKLEEIKKNSEEVV